MANLPQIAHCYVDDLDPTTMQAMKIDSTTNSPQYVTVGDTTPTGLAPWSRHHSSGASQGYEVYWAHPGISPNALVGMRPVIYQFGNPYEGPTAATATIQITTNPTTGAGSDYDTIRIGGTTHIYRLFATLAAQNDVLIGATASETARNLAHAIQNHAGTTGTQYHDSTEAHRSVRATWSGDTVTVTSRLTGTLGNSIQLIKGSSGTGGGGAYDFNSTGGSTSTTLLGGGGQHIVQGGAYYALPGGWLTSASHGYYDANEARSLLWWTYTAPALPTVSNGGAVTENVQLELVKASGGGGDSLITLTASGSTQCLGRTVYSSNGGGIDVPASSFIWARVPAAAGNSWEAPPGCVWTLAFGRKIG